MDISVIIYIFMVVLVVPVFYWKGSGLIPLLQASVQLRHAAQLLEAQKRHEEIRSSILKHSGAAGDELPENILKLENPVLRAQLSHYRSDARRMSLKMDSKSQCDISDYFDDVTIERIGNTVYADHVCSALTGLGLLGTFIGMTNGLTGFDANSSATALASISILLGGMKYAFMTSICGIGLSLLLGILMRTFRRNAEESMDQFVSSFQSNVLSNQQEAVYNQILDELRSISNRLSRNHNDDMRHMEILLEAFVEQLATRLQLQVQDMQSSMAAIASQQQKYASTVAALNSQLSTAANEVAGVSRAFCELTTQGNMLEEHIQKASRALGGSVEDLKNMVKIDADVLEKHNDLATKLQQSAGELTSLSSVLNDQVRNTASVIQNLSKFTTTAVEETAVGCTNLIQVHCQEIKEQMKAMMTTTAAQNEQIRDESVKQMEAIRQVGSRVMAEIRADNDKTMNNMRVSSERIIRDMPQTVAVRKELDALIQQNEQLIQSQIQLQQDINQRNRLVARFMKLWRSKQ